MPPAATCAAANPVLTKSIFDAPRPGDGLRVLVTRYHPRGVRKDRYDVWMRCLAPSPGLLSAYKHGGLGWDMFERRLLRDMRSDESARKAVHMLRDCLDDRPVTLLCYEPDDEKCHRHIVGNLIEGGGV